MRPAGQTGSRLGMGPPGQTLSRLGMGPPGEAAPPQRSQDQGSRRWWGEDWRGGAVVDAGAEVIQLDLAEISLLIYPGAGSP